MREAPSIEEGALLCTDSSSESPDNFPLTKASPQGPSLATMRSDTSANQQEQKCQDDNETPSAPLHCQTVSQYPEDEGGDDDVIWQELFQQPAEGPCRLFAREEETRLLANCYKRCQHRDDQSTHHGIVLITGVSGTGKTALARCLEPTVQKDHGFFLRGKCNQLQRKTTLPYAPFAEALGRFVEDLLRRADKKSLSSRQRLRQAVVDATRDTGTALLDAIPALQKLSIPSSSAQKSASNSTARHICVTFGKILKKFCSPEGPLVLLLDDLQWLDSASLTLFQSLALESIPGFLLLGTCRGNEVSLDDQLAVVLRSIEDENVPITDIRLNNLSFPALQTLLKEMLRLDSPSLADLVFRQTQGNPFFALQFVRNLYDTNVLRFNHTQQQWIWSSSKLSVDSQLEQEEREHQATLDCNALVAAIMATLVDASPAVEQVLGVASCLGAEFAHTHVQAATHLDPNALSLALQILQQRGIIMDNKNAPPNRTYRWVHDRFQQVAYELIPPDQRVMFHVSLGLLLLQRMSPLEQHNNPFVVVNQFCHATIPLELHQLEQKDKDDLILKLAQLCLLAGNKASLSSAYDTAAIYFRYGIDVLLLETAQRHDTNTRKAKENTNTDALHDLLNARYDIGIALCNALAHAECCVGNFEAVDELVGFMADHPKTEMQDKLTAYETHIISLGSRQDLDGAVRLGFKVLKELLGEVYPRQPSFLQVATQVLKTKFRLGRMKEADILNLKPMRDSRVLAASRIMHLIYPPCVRVNPKLSVLLLTRGTALLLKYGLSPLAPLLLNGFAMLVCHPLGDIQEGKRLADIGMQLVNMEEYNALDVRCRILLSYWGFTKGWYCPIQDCLEPLKQAADIGAISGDIEMVCLSYFCYIQIAFLASGRPLLQTEREFSELHETFANRHQETILFFLKVSQQALQCLREPSHGKSSACELSGDFFQEESGLAQARGVGDELGITTIYIFKCLLAVYLNQPQHALAAAKRLQKCTTDGFTVILVYQAVFLSGLAEVMAARASKKQQKWSRAGKAAIQKLKQYSVHAPENVTNKIYLIQAHRKALQGKQDLAHAQFELSIHHAQQSGFLNEEALACEHAAIANLEWGERDSGLVLLRRSQALYERWGSLVKVEQISHLIQKQN